MTFTASTIKQLSQRYIHISLAEQRLRLVEDNKILFDVRIASAKNGPGERFASECTPRGWHKIRAKIGHNCPENSIFIGRRPSGDIWSEKFQQKHPGQDWILSRIMWLSGLQVGFNRLGQCDTMRRYIYIHGCPDTHPMGVASSHGCIKMRNADIIELFDLVDTGIVVLIDTQSLTIDD